MKVTSLQNDRDEGQSAQVMPLGIIGQNTYYDEHFEKKSRLIVVRILREFF